VKFKLDENLSPTLASGFISAGHEAPERVDSIDQVLGTRDVERVTGRHRCTIYR